jgi:Tol biopolymer transport system component/DNA-binding winged helix-turn-helix (wHTH) protein
VNRRVSGAAPTAFRLAGWIIRPAFFRIEGPQGPTTIEPRCMGVLVCLASRPGEVVSRNEILDEIWSDVTVGEEVLTRAVSQLRQVFGDDPKNPRFIETIRGGGYRLVAPVEAAPPERADRTPARTSKRLPRAGWVTGAVGTVALIAAFAVLGSRTGEPDAQRTGTGYIEGVPVTTAPGQELFPAVAPSGHLVVFAAGEGEQSGLYLTQARSERWVRLTESPGSDVYPRWSHDGSMIVFVRRHGGESTVCRVPALGGAVHCGPPGPGRVYGLDWVPGEDAVVLSESSSEGGFVPLKKLSLSDSRQELLTESGADLFAGDTQPRFNRQGTKVAFVRCDHAGIQDVWTMAWPEGTPIRLTHGLGSILGLDWARDGESLIVAAAPDGRSRLWRIHCGSGDRSVIPTPDAQAIHPAVDPTDGTLVYVSRRVNDSIWHLSRGADGDIVVRGIAESSRRDSAPSWSPDGERIAFVSNRSGTWQIWSADLEHGTARRATALDIGQPSRPHFDAGGSRLAFSVLESAAERSMVLDLSTGRLRRLPTVGRHDMVIGWSGDGRVVARCDTGTERQIVLIDPESEAVEILDLGRSDGLAVRVAGGQVFFSSEHDKGLWVYRIDDRSRRRVVDESEYEGWSSWAPSRTGVLFVPRGEGLRVDRLDLATGAIERDLFDLPEGIVSVTPSPDGAALLAVRRMQGESDLVALEGVG